MAQIAQTIGHDQTGSLLERFPHFELSYETISHKKVSHQTHNIAMAIPQGKKYYIWFSYDIADDTIYIMELNKEKYITKIQKMPHFMGVRWSIGTILYGVLLDAKSNNSKPVFVIEDLLQFQGFPMKNMTFGEKLPLLYELFTSATDSEAIRFCLPAMWPYYGNTPEITIPDRFSNLPYQVHHIQYRSLCDIVPLLNFTIRKDETRTNTVATDIASSSHIPTDVSGLCRTILGGMRSTPCYTKPQYRQKTIFKMCADIQYDIYHLFAYGKNKSMVYYDLAYIPNYKTSVFINSLFRNIRENRNLDYIEESDDEDDFQNVANDKYVDLQKILCIECQFHPKFRRWVPLKVVKTPCKIVHVSQL
jgi:hypothetical protein